MNFLNNNTLFLAAIFSMIVLSGCINAKNHETKFDEIPTEYIALLNTKAKDIIDYSSSRYFTDGSCLPNCNIGFKNGSKMTIESFYKRNFTIDSVDLINEHSGVNTGVLYSEMGYLNNERWLSLESGKYIDHLTIKSTPASNISKGKSFLSVSLNAKTFSYELNHSSINSFNTSKKFESINFSFILLNSSKKVYLITLSDRDSNNLNFLEYLNLDEVDKLDD